MLLKNSFRIKSLASVLKVEKKQRFFCKNHNSSGVKFSRLLMYECFPICRIQFDLEFNTLNMAALQGLFGGCDKTYVH